MSTKGFWQYNKNSAPLLSKLHILEKSLHLTRWDNCGMEILQKGGQCDALIRLECALVTLHKSSHLDWKLELLECDQSEIIRYGWVWQ